MVSQRKRQRRRARLWLAVFLTFGVTFGMAMIAQPGPSSAATDFMFGATPEAIGGFRQAGVAEIESQLGRKLDLVRVFERWDSNFPSAFHSQMVDEGRLMVVSVRPKRENGTVIPWVDIANAQPGSQLHEEMKSWADRIGDTGVPVWFAFHHEPEASGSSPYGDAAEFIAAYRAFVDVFRSRGATNVDFAWIMTSWSFETSPSDDRSAGKWYPGDDYVDLIGSDAYNWDQCRSSATDYWRTLEDTIDPQRQFGLAHPEKGLFLAEVGSTEKPGNWGDAKASWIAEGAALFKKSGWGQFVAASWFDVTDDSYPNCHWPIDSSPEAIAALKAMANDPFYVGGGNPPPPTTQPPPTTTQPPPSTTQPPPVSDRFTDVGVTHQFKAQIEWMAGQGITAGCNPPVNDRFCPDASVTRGQMAAFLVRALDYRADGGGNLFVDDDGSPFEVDIDRLATAGVTFGCSPPVNDRFCPDAPVTRGQMAAFMYRALN